MRLRQTADRKITGVTPTLIPLGIGVTTVTPVVNVFLPMTHRARFLVFRLPLIACAGAIGAVALAGLWLNGSRDAAGSYLHADTQVHVTVAAAVVAGVVLVLAIRSLLRVRLIDRYTAVHIRGVSKAFDAAYTAVIEGPPGGGPDAALPVPSPHARPYRPFGGSPG